MMTNSTTKSKAPPLDFNAVLRHEIERTESLLHEAELWHNSPASPDFNRALDRLVSSLSKAGLGSLTGILTEVVDPNEISNGDSDIALRFDEARKFLRMLECGADMISLVRAWRGDLDSKGVQEVLDSLEHEGLVTSDELKFRWHAINPLQYELRLISELSRLWEDNLWGELYDSQYLDLVTIYAMGYLSELNALLRDPKLDSKKDEVTEMVFERRLTLNAIMRWNEDNDLHVVFNEPAEKDDFRGPFLPDDYPLVPKNVDGSALV